MASLDSIVNVVIKVLKQSVTRASFNNVLLLPKDANLRVASITTSKTLTYSNLTEMVDDGWKPYDQAYIAATQIFAQATAPTTIKVGYWDADGGKTASEALAAIDTVDADYFFVLPLTETEAEIASAGSYVETRDNPAMVFGQVADAASLTGAGNAQALRALARKWTASFYHSPPAHLSTLTISGAFQAGASVTLKVNGTAIGPYAIGAGTSDDMLAAIALGIQGTAEVSTAVVTTVAGGTDNDREIVITGVHGTYVYISDWVDGGGNPVGATQADTNLGPEWLTAAVVGVACTTQPGSETWKFIQPAAMTADALTTSERSTLVAAKCNYLTTFGSIAMTAEGKTTFDEWIDTQRYVGWLAINLQADCVQLLLNASPNKVPYDDGGIAMFENVIRTRLLLGEKYGGAIQGSSAVVVPLRADVDPALVTARELDITFSQLLAGAVHTLKLTGTVSE